MNKKRASLMELVIAFCLFVVFTVGIMLIDVQPIGPLNSKIGLATLNGAIFSALGQSSFWYGVSKILGYVAILLAVVFVLAFFVQWIQRKKIFLVDRYLWSFILFAFYVILAYVFFEIFVVNHRPILDENGLLEASYPSSHTMLGVSVFAYTFSRIKYYLKPGALLALCRLVLILLSGLMVVSRLLSGVHWFSDIFGALLLSYLLFTLNEFSFPLLGRVCEGNEEE